MMEPDLLRERPLVLIADDDPTMRLLARAALEQAGFEVMEAADGQECLAGFQRLRPDIVLLDLLMPGMDGFAVLTELRHLPEGDSTPILMFTGMDDLASINRAYEAGATDFITKPINWTILGHRVRYMLRASRTLWELQKSERRLAHAQQIARLGYWHWHRENNTMMWSGEIHRIFGLPPENTSPALEIFLEQSHPDDRESVKMALEAALSEGKPFGIDCRIIPGDAPLRIIHLQGQALGDGTGKAVSVSGTVQDITARKRVEEALAESLANLRHILNATVGALATAIEMRDPYTAGHQRRVAQLAKALAEEMGFSAEQVDGMRVMGFLHDIGKIVVPAEILSRPGQINEHEYNMVRSHAEASHTILKEIEFPWPVAKAICQHHEKLNGSGYPFNLAGPEIIMEARILAVADVAEAMSSHRPYRPALGIEQAMEEISQNKNILYDPQVVEACLTLFTKKNFRFD